MPNETQNITYTAFNKVSKITEKTGNDTYELTISYGPDQQRCKSILKKNNVTVKTIIFAPGYERVTDAGGATRHFYYIYGGDGLAAVQIKESGQTDKICYAHTDHLGSIVKLTDKDGAVLFSASYDAWGKQTITANTIGFHRGYTGHEHLAEFGLINMNGRVYDPILGRMLSPDNYVQSPYNSQSYNRYSYCLNNPLKYTDPSGDFFWLIPNISWSKNGGLSIGISGVFGLPGVLSAQIGIGYNFKSGEPYAYTAATSMMTTLSHSYTPSGGFNTSLSVGLSPFTGLPFSSNLLTASVGYNYKSNSWGGNLSMWDWNKNGFLFNPSLSAMVFPEHTTNLVRGKGFRSNDAVLKRFYDNGQCQEALDYFGFEGKYDLDIETPAEFNPKNGIIRYNEHAFDKGYDYLYASYREEIFHKNDYLKAKKDIPKDVEYWDYEEWRAQVHMYKNQGLYPNGNKNWVWRINSYGLSSGLYDGDIVFKERWWHVIYKIPRKW